MQTIESERLILRGFTEKDADDLFRYAADPDVGPRGMETACHPRGFARRRAHVRTVTSKQYYRLFPETSS